MAGLSSLSVKIPVHGDYKETQINFDTLGFNFCRCTVHFEIYVVHLSQYLTDWMHKICFIISFISCLYMFRAHVLIIRRSKLHYTASGIITPIAVMIPEAM